MTIPHRNLAVVSTENQRTATAGTTLETTTYLTTEFDTMSSTDSFKPIPTRKLTTSRNKVDEKSESEIYRPTMKTIVQTKSIQTTPENIVRNSILSPSVKPSPGLKVKYLKTLTLESGLCEDYRPKNRFDWKQYC